MRIHIKSKPGLYTVEAYGRNTITLSTKHNLFQVPTSDFKAFAGGLHNYSVTKQEQDMFLSVVSPDTYKIQLDFLVNNGGISTLFSGQCKDINTFRKLCKLLHI